jgi:hypothetical protein
MTQLIHVNSGRIYGVYMKETPEILYTLLLAIFLRWIRKAENARNVINHHVVTTKEERENFCVFL